MVLIHSYGVGYRIKEDYMEFSILNQSPILNNHTVKESLKNTIDLAIEAENLGYKRYFVSEHHNMDSLIGTSPEVLVSHLAAHTKHLHIGAGGIMLSHHNPFHVAEQFQLLNHLAPGRIDLGVGKAPGGTPTATAALQHELREDIKPFNERFIALKNYLQNKHSNAEELQVSPDTNEPPALFLLGGSVESAKFAAEEGVNYIFAHFINNDIELLNQVVNVYKEHSANGKLIVALSTLVTDDEETKEFINSENQYYQLTFKDGRKLRVFSEEQVNNFLDNSEEEIKVKKRQAKIILGNQTEVLHTLNELDPTNKIDEFMFHLPTKDASIRLNTVRALAPAHITQFQKAGI